MVSVSVPCDKCDKPLRTGDRFCENCGAVVGDDVRSSLPARREFSDYEVREHCKRVRSASNAILILSIMFAISGALFYAMQASEVAKALRPFDGVDASTALESAVNGATTVGELRDQLRREPYQVLGVNVFLGVVMLGLYFWSKKSLLPAVMTALGIYVAVIVASAIFDPATIVRGIIVKIVVIGMLAKGIQAALAARAAERET